MSKQKRQTAEAVESTPELMIDSAARWPDPLDHRIAAVILRTRTNDVSDGYDLTLSASFGAERISLQAGELQLSARLSIKSADIVLSFVNSDANPIETDDLNYSEGWTRTENETQSSRTSREAKVGISGTVISKLRGNASANIAGSFAESRNDESKAQLQHKQRDWFIQTVGSVRVGRFDKVLDGPIVSNLTAWRIIPRAKTARSGVIARVIVREGWISFDDLDAGSIPASIKYKVEQLLVPSNERRRRLFLALLSQLVVRRLQEDSIGRDATLAMAAIVVKPYETNTITLSKPSTTESLKIPLGPIEQFLFSDEGNEDNLVLGLGGTREGIDDERSQYLFIPQSSPTRTVAALKVLFESASPIRRVDLEKSFGRSAVRDLGGFKLISVDRAGVVAPTQEDVSPEYAVKLAATRLPAIMAARQMLVNDPAVILQCLSLK